MFNTRVIVSFFIQIAPFSTSGQIKTLLPVLKERTSSWREILAVKFDKVKSLKSKVGHHGSILTDHSNDLASSIKNFDKYLRTDSSIVPLYNRSYSGSVRHTDTWTPAKHRLPLLNDLALARFMKQQTGL